MTINILFYGNCQLIAVTQTLKFSSKFNVHNYECFSTEISKEEFTNIKHEINSYEARGNKTCQIKKSDRWKVSVGVSLSLQRNQKIKKG